MALSVPRCLGAEIPVSDFDRCGERGHRKRDTSHLRFCRLRGGGVERSSGPCALGVDGSSQGGDIATDGSSEGADLDAIVSSVSAIEEEAILGQSFLGQRLLCGHGGSGCGNDTQVCALSREEGTAAGAAAVDRLRVMLTAQLLGPPPLGAGPCPPYGGIF